MSISDQFGRFCKLYVTGPTGDGLELSQFRIVFHVHQNDFESPNYAEIKVYNLTRETMNQIQKEFSSVHLEAGYQNGNHGTIFNGTISQMRIGRENNIDNFMEILAHDGDSIYNDKFMATSVAKGTTFKQRIDQITAQTGINFSETPSPNNPKYVVGALRGKVLFGLPRSEIRNIASSCDSSWSIQDGKVQMIETAGYLPGDAVELSALTGLIGVPVQTDQGMVLQCLLNQKIRIGGLISLKNAEISDTEINDLVGYNRYKGIVHFAPMAPDGKYRVLVAEHHGDTRGDDWSTEITALAVDQTGNLILAAP
jgi:hypothetical protein